MQPPFSLVQQGAAADLLPYCAERRIGVMVYVPLAHGLPGGHLTETSTFANDDWRSRSPLLSRDVLRRNLAVMEELRTLGASIGATVARVAIAWVLAQPRMDVAIVGARDSKQVEGVIGAAELQMSDRVLAEIERIAAQAAPVAAPYPKRRPTSQDSAHGS